MHIPSQLRNGPAHLWVTFTPDEQSNPLVKVCAGETTWQLDLELMSTLSRFARAQLATRAPVTFSELYDIMIHNTLKHLFGIDLSGESEGLSSVYGPVQAVRVVTGFQEKGTPHAHILIWFKGVPPTSKQLQQALDDPGFKAHLDTYREHLSSTACPDSFLSDMVKPPLPVQSEAVANVDISVHGLIADLADFLAFLQATINNLARRFEVHRHAPSCYKHGNAPCHCRHHFPYKVEELARVETKSDNILEYIAKQLHPWIVRCPDLVLLCLRGNCNSQPMDNFGVSKNVIYYAVLCYASSQGHDQAHSLAAVRHCHKGR